MMAGVNINAEALIVARESRGRSQKNVAEAAGVTQGLISKAENGLVNIAPDDVTRIAAHLDYPARFFYEPGRFREAGSACVYHRKRKTLPAGILRGLNARMYVRNVNTAKLFDGLNISAERSFHTMDPDEYGGSPVEVARALRSTWRLPDGPIPNLTTLIESAGGIVILEDFGTRKLFGMSCWTSKGHPLFFLNAAMPTDDLRWTMAHELGHLTMHATPPTGDPETQADAFAGEFLAPASVFRSHARKLTFDRLANVKSYWRISMKAIIKRAESIGAIDNRAAVRLYKQHSARGYNTIEPYPVPPEPPTIVDQAIRVHLQEHGYTSAEVADAMLLTNNEFSRDFLRAPVGDGNVVSLFDHAPLASA
jgi:Zn-dependent peptidase ImmA (M78 family)/transcriptional regulator with XRE-family HTH domain